MAFIPTMLLGNCKTPVQKFDSHNDSRRQASGSRPALVSIPVRLLWNRSLLSAICICRVCGWCIVGGTNCTYRTEPARRDDRQDDLFALDHSVDGNSMHGIPNSFNCAFFCAFSVLQCEAKMGDVRRVPAVTGHPTLGQSASLCLVHAGLSRGDPNLVACGLHVRGQEKKEGKSTDKVPTSSASLMKLSNVFCFLFVHKAHLTIYSERCHIQHRFWWVFRLKAPHPH